MIDEKRLYQALGERIRRLRESRSGERRMTQAELARLVGLERTSITNIERGNQKVPLHVIYRVCEALGITITDALPSVIEVQRLDDEIPLQELEFSGETLKAPPLVAEAVTSLLLQRGENSDSTKD